MKFKITIASLLILSLAGCIRAPDSQVVSENMKDSADNFQINRRVIFYNSISDTLMYSVEGKCSITKDNTDNQLELLCKVGPNLYKKHFLGLSDNVTYFVEQLEPKKESAYHYKVVYKPQTIIPDIQVKTSLTEEQ